MRVTMFDKVTGKRLNGGSKNSPHIQALVAQNHIVVAGNIPKGKMYDIPNSIVVDDPDYINNQNAKAQRKQDRKDAKTAIGAVTGDFKSGPNLDADKVNDFLLELKKYIDNE